MDGLDMLNDGPGAPEKGQDGLQAAMAVVAPDVRERLMHIAIDHQINRADPAWLLVEAAVVSMNAASAANESAQAVQAGVSAIPDKIFQGAVKAGDEIRGALAAEIRGQGVEVGQALKMLIDSASQTGAASLKTAAADLDVKMAKIPADVQKSLDAYRDKGIAEFAASAKAAGEKAAQTALLAQASRSAITVILAFLVACGVGATGFWGYLKLEHRLMPAGVTAQADPVRGGTLVSIPNGGTPVKCQAALCVLYPH